MRRKWIQVYDLSGNQYSVNKNIRFKTLMPRPDLCDYSDLYIVVKGRITVAGTNANTVIEKIKSQPLRIMLHLDYAYEKSTTHS